MENLVTPKDIQERYGLKCLKTAKKYLQQMYHYENPWGAPLWAFEEWEESRAVMPEGVTPKRECDILNRKQNDRTYVPRKRG